MPDDNTKAIAGASPQYVSKWPLVTRLLTPVANSTEASGTPGIDFAGVSILPRPGLGDPQREFATSVRGMSSIGTVNRRKRSFQFPQQTALVRCRMGSL